MKKIKADMLVRKLVTNKISRAEFDEFLCGLEDEQMVLYLESSLKSHFDAIMEDHASGVEQPEDMRNTDESPPYN